MDVTESTLKTILEGSKQYLVPLYQRPYAWRVSNWQKIWDDLLELLELRRQHQNTSHFTGTLVLEAGEVTTGLTKFLVVDGQQRLTTLTLLIAAIAKKYEDRDETESAKRIREQVLINPYASNLESRYRLRPANFDEPTYRTCIDGGDIKSDVSLVDDAFRFFDKAIFGLEKTDFSLEELEAGVLNGLKFVSITAKQDDNVYRIFESINNTGIDLTQADLIRNLIFSRLHQRAEEVHDFKWKPLQRGLDSSDIENLFWIDAQWRRPEERRLNTYDFQKRRINQLADEELLEFLDQMLAMANALRKVRLIDDTEDAAVGTELEQLDELGIPGALVLITKIVYLFETKQATSEQTATALRVVKSFLVRRTLGSIPISSLQQICASAANELVGNIDEEIRRILSTGKKSYIKNDDFRRIILEQPIYERSRKSRLKVILSWLLQESQGKDIIDFSSMTIEHVLPQRLSAEAKREFEATLENPDALAESHEQVVHTLGNLTLTNYNSELSNSPFSTKKNSWLSNTSVAENRLIAGQAHWGTEQIRNRASRLADLAIRIWPGPDETLVELETDSIGQRIDEVVRILPAGSWTSYGEIAKYLGTAGQVVGQRVSKGFIEGAWRVLRANGEIAPGFHWPKDSIHAGKDPKDVLEQEGIIFDERNQASDSQRLRAEELADLFGDD